MARVGIRKVESERSGKAKSGEEERGVSGETRDSQSISGQENYPIAYG